jgi:hypothetical protein
MQKEVLTPISSAVAIVTNAESNPLAILDSLLLKFVDNASSTGDVIDEFAIELCVQFNKDGIAWYDLKGKHSKPVNEYRTKFVETFEKPMKIDKKTNKLVRKFSDAVINSYWGRVKVASGKVVQAKVVGDIINVRKLTLDDLMTAIRRVEKAEGDANNKYIDFALVSDELDLMKDMFVRLGGNIDDKGNLSSPL